MRKLLNTLFVMSEDAYLSLEDANIVLWKNQERAAQLPLLNLENILYFGYRGASPALLGECAKRNIGFCFFKTKWAFFSQGMWSKPRECIAKKSTISIVGAGALLLYIVQIYDYR